jgi:hypothetical protein
MIRNIYVLFPLFAFLISCGGSLSEGDAQRGSTGLSSVVSDAKKQLAGLFPTSSSLMFLSAENAASFSTVINGLGSPGGMTCGSVGANQSPSAYIQRAIDAEFKCGEATATAFGRFDQDSNALEIISGNVPFSNGRLIPGAYVFTANVEGNNLEITAVVTNLADSEFDSLIRVSSSQFDVNVFFRARDGITNLFSYDDCRTASDLCESIALRWGHLYIDQATGYVSYEYISVQPAGATLEVQRLFRPANSSQIYMIHSYGTASDKMNKLIVYAPNGTSSTQLSISANMAGDTTYSTAGILCVNSNSFASTDGVCPGHSISTEAAELDFSSLTWGNATTLFNDNVNVSGNAKNRVRSFTNISEFFSF